MLACLSNSLPSVEPRRASSPVTLGGGVAACNDTALMVAPLQIDQRVLELKSAAWFRPVKKFSITFAAVA